MTFLLDGGELRHRIRIQRPVPDDAPDGAGSGSWETVATVRAQVQDVLPSRGERLAGGFNIATRPARVRIRFRRDITPDMRFLVGRVAQDGSWVTERTMQIVAGPADLGPRVALEFMAEDYTSAGNTA